MNCNGGLPWHPHPSRPRLPLPPGSVDAHCHVFGPADRFPFAPGRRYTPGDAGKAALWALRDHLGFARNVVVQATCHGTDNRALADACGTSQGRARGVAAVDADATPGALRALHAAGVRGARVNFVRRLGDFADADAVRETAARIGPLGWHLVVHLEAADFPALQPLLAALPLPVVIDHMGRPDVALPVDGPAFGGFVAFMAAHRHVWTKVTCPERLSRNGPPARPGEAAPYRDVVPFARRLVQAFPDRVLWGTDWPHPNLADHMPDDGALVDFIAHIAPTHEQRQRLLVDNPMRLYWPEEAAGARP